MAKIGIRLLALSFIVLSLLIVAASRIGNVLHSPVLSFISNAYGNRDIFLLDARTRQLHNFTQSPNAEEWSYVWSRDGSQMIFTQSTIAAGDDVYVMLASGRNLRQVQALPTLQAFNLTWSNDGQTLAYFSSRQNTSDIYLISLAENTVTNMTDSAQESESVPEWSPNGFYLLFMMQGDIYLRDMRTHNIQRLTYTPTLEEYAVWSPDSSQVIFQVDERAAGERRLYHLSLTSGTLQMLDMPVAPRAQPVSWSPDNRHFTITLETQQVITYDIATGTIQTLTDGTQRISSAVWSADGRYIAYIENRLIQIYDLHTAKTLRLDGAISALAPLVWQP
jgi:Tol biopolymer transport system component